MTTLVRIQPTYEELKLVQAGGRHLRIARIQPTYEELKQFKRNLNKVLDSRIQPTYEELKQTNALQISMPVRSVSSLPMRN